MHVTEGALYQMSTIPFHLICCCIICQFIYGKQHEVYPPMSLRSGQVYHWKHGILVTQWESCKIDRHNISTFPNIGYQICIWHLLRRGRSKRQQRLYTMVQGQEERNASLFVTTMRRFICKLLFTQYMYKPFEF